MTNVCAFCASSSFPSGALARAGLSSPQSSFAPSCQCDRWSQFRTRGCRSLCVCPNYVEEWQSSRLAIDEPSERHRLIQLLLSLSTVFARKKSANRSRQGCGEVSGWSADKLTGLVSSPAVRTPLDERTPFPVPPPQFHHWVISSHSLKCLSLLKWVVGRSFNDKGACQALL